MGVKFDCYKIQPLIDQTKGFKYSSGVKYGVTIVHTIMSTVTTHIGIVLHYLVVQMLLWGSIGVESSNALGQLWITRSPLCPLLSVLAWQQLLRGLGSPERQKRNTW